MMENMDISCGAVDPGNDSAMSVDEGMDVCSDYENNLAKEFAFNVNTTVQEANNSAGCTSSNATSEMGDSANTTVVLNSSFPHQQDSAPDGADQITRFPLAIAKECNQTNNSLNNSKERIKSNLVTNAISNEMRLAGKENIFANSWDQPRFEFPVETKRHSDKWPLDRPEVALMASSTPAQSNFEAEEEHFTPANDYIFSAADFDCLLSRGSAQAVTAAVTASAASSSQGAAAADLPRNSVLINFDPLLRRQTIAKADNNSSIGILETTSACLALVDFAQQQQQQGQNPFSPAPLVPLLDRTEYEPASVVQEQEVTTEQLNQTLTTGEGGSAEEELGTLEQGGEKSGIDPVDNTIVESSVSSVNSESISLLDRSTSQLQEDNGCSVLPLKPAEHLSLSGGSIEQDFLESLTTEKQYTEQLFTQTDNPVIEHVQEDILLQQTDGQAALCEIISTDDAEHQQEHVEPAADSAEAVFVVSQSNSSRDAESEKDIDSIAKFVSTPVESNALISPSNMLAEPLQEKQNSTIHNMSDDRMAHALDEHVETAKKSKSEDINIADMEKKMHDVELREENMLKRITEKDKTISKMSNVVEAYERTIAELISEKEMLIRNHDLECESLKQDNEINAQHLESLEKTFSNLYAKYERMKKNAVKYKEHEEKLLEKVMKLEECIRAQEQRYEKMKSHAMSQLEIANTKIDEAIRNHSQESAKLKAQIKKEELYRISINEQLIQKSKENEELVKICDELISETN
uniref:Transforming acidic coiled-coil-containing protein C-terminal domain-containing protein n=1 Tax=Anopheles atroparvus TaxID=41427 RepID=A0A182IJR7_ANOAO